MSDIDPIIIKLSVDASGAADAVADFTKETKASIEAAYTTSVDRAKAKLDELARKHKEVADTIEVERRKLVELQNQREQSGGIARKQIDQEIENMKKLILAHEGQRIELDKKRLKLEEVGKLAVVTNEAEAAAIKANTDAQIVNLNVMKDSQKAHANVNEEMSAGISIGRNFFTVMGGWYIINSITGKAEEILAKIRQEMEGINTAGEKLRGLSGGQFERLTPVFNEFGFTTGSQQSEATAVINQIASKANLTQEVTASAAAGLAPVLAANKVEFGSDQFRGLVANTGIFANRGIDPNLAANFVGEALQKDPGLTGSELNKQLTALTSLGGGSASRTNEFLGILAGEKEKFTAAGLSTTDAEKIFARLSQTAPPQEVPTLARQAFQSMDRLLGLGPEEQIDMMEKLNIGGVHSLNSIFQKSLNSGGQIDVRSVLTAMSKMTPEQRAIAARTIAGPRGAVALSSVAGFEGVQLPGGGLTFPPSSPDQTAKVLAQQEDAATASGNPTDPFAAEFSREVGNEETVLERNPERLQGISHGAAYWFSHIGTLGIAGGYTASTKEQAAANVYGQRFIALARRLKAIKSGQIKAGPGEVEKIQSLMQDLQEQFLPYARSAPAAQQFFGEFISGTDDANQILDSKNSDYDIFNQNYGYRNAPADIIDDRKAAPLIRRSDELLHQPQPAPPGPVGIINYNRIINYGAGYDSIGAPLQNDDRFG